MPRLITLFADMTFKEKKTKSQEDNLPISKDKSVKFSLGQSIFTERLTTLDYLKIWKRRRSIAIMLDGSDKVMHLEKELNEDGTVKTLAFSLEYGTAKAAESMVARTAAKNTVEKKPLSNTQFIVIAVLLGLVVVLQLMMLRGVTI